MIVAQMLMVLLVHHLFYMSVDRHDLPLSNGFLLSYGDKVVTAKPSQIKQLNVICIGTLYKIFYYINIETKQSGGLQNMNKFYLYLSGTDIIYKYI